MLLCKEVITAEDNPPHNYAARNNISTLALVLLLLSVCHDIAQAKAANWFEITEIRSGPGNRKYPTFGGLHQLLELSECW